MKKIIIGGLAVLLGVSGISHYFFTLMGILAGALPVILILGGLLALYIGYTDLKAEDEVDTVTPSAPAVHVEDEPAPVSDTAEASEKAEPSGDDTFEPSQEPTREPEAANDKAAPNVPETAVPETTSEDAPAPPLFKGNSDTLVFHSIDCKFSQGKNCTVEFDTREAALEQGYTPCKVCKP